MAHPYHHAVSSAKKWGGEPAEFEAIHAWFDESKAAFGDFRHRALRHHAFGIFECEQVFGSTLTLSTGRLVPVRVIGEQHVMEDCGRIPTVQDWLSSITAERWMNSPARLSRLLRGDADVW
ncbi:MAG: hypothetical protein EBV64_11820 [Oxalobacteraceae bacterium]|nr:hypothetical protein [Oxalobacteraceae bacterium]